MGNKQDVVWDHENSQNFFLHQKQKLCKWLPLLQKHRQVLCSLKVISLAEQPSLLKETSLGRLFPSSPDFDWVAKNDLPLKIQWSIITLANSNGMQKH